MSRKRGPLPEIFKPKKKCVRPAQDEADTQDGDLSSVDMNSMPNDTLAALLYMKKLFPMEKFDDRIPPIVLKHQLYSIVKNRTIVDKQINDLKESGEIKVIKLGAEPNELSIVFSRDYEVHVDSVMRDVGVHKHIIEKFLSRVVKNCRDVCLDRETLMKDYRFKDEEVTQLVRASVLTVRDVGSWWLAIPNAGIFIKNFVRGRKAMLMMIKKSKYREVLQKDLEQRRWPKMAKLGVMYHIHDVIGADLVENIQTTSGKLLRLKE
ncbi:serine/threonine-protein kinase 19-like [Gigantopelta aegis]|uniref:serine/threonine-protein kinase 19-like n=1 Tax=Gigantopelta aegis TaxID=1735272 RepID=UPI001B8882E0|nr:serine/threonine-protein kinase 19-like [Gigantopelta aegis]XP_041364571.1 serine/threonine-protein kinase 19-like [Gigantopelta aegis]